VLFRSVLELVAGIVLGPSILGWVQLGRPLELLSMLGLAFLLFLGGLEFELARFRGALARTIAVGFALSFGLAFASAAALDAAGLIASPLLVAIIASATALGVVIPVVKDLGHARTPFGQLVLAAASLADVATILLLSLLFSEHSAGTGARVVLAGCFIAVVVGVGVALRGAGRASPISAVLFRLQDTSAQIRVRGAFLVLLGFVALAGRFGLEAVLGAFAAGVFLTLVDRDRAMTHPAFRAKLEAVGFGIFIPFFFVTSGVRFDLDALLADEGTLMLVPVFVALLLLARGAPAFVYRRLLPVRQVLAAGLLQATSLSFIVVATQLGTELALLERSTSAAFVAAGLVSVLLFPLSAATLLGRSRDMVESAPATAA
jgi:Kef-type K+ transport system membrane component KefB